MEKNSCHNAIIYEASLLTSHADWHILIYLQSPGFNTLLGNKEHVQHCQLIRVTIPVLVCLNLRIFTVFECHVWRCYHHRNNIIELWIKYHTILICYHNDFVQSSASKSVNESRQILSLCFFHSKHDPLCVFATFLVLSLLLYKLDM